MSSQDLTLPEASIADSPVNTTDTTKLFTPNMILVSTLLGGSIAGCGLMAYNYKAIGEKDKAVKALLWGFGILIAAFILGLVISHFINTNGAATGISVGVALMLKNMSKSAFGVNRPKIPWWISILTGILAIIPTLILVFILSMLAAAILIHK